MRRTFRRAAPAVLGVLAAVFVAGAVAGGLAADAVRRSSDVVWPLGALHPGVTTVAIDPRAQQEYGPWPWPRDLQARLVDAAVDAGASAIGYDVVLPESAGSGAADADLAEALDRVPSVVAVAYASVVRGPRGLYLASDPLEPSGSVRGAASVGHVVVPSDADGTTRSVPLVVQAPEGVLLPSFVLRLAAGADAAGPVVRPNAVQLGSVTIPTERGAVLRISWASGLSRPDLVSAADVLAGDIDLNGAVTLIGLADPSIGDAHVTPLQPGATTPGVVIQAAALSTILASAWVAPMPWWLAALLTLILGTLCASAALRVAPWTAVGVTAASVGAYAVAALLLVPSTGILPDLVRVPAGIIGAAIGAGAVRILRERRERRRTTDLFARYVPEGVAARLLTDRGEDALHEGTRTHAAVLFCDLRGFTPLAAAREPAEVRRALDLYYDYACRCIFERGGTVMQFVGDEVFAVFGLPEPLSDPDAAARGAALALVAGRDALDEELHAAGLPPLMFGVGLHSGEVVAATVGPRNRRQFAVVGDAVNVGSRLCDAARAGEIVASERAAGDTWDECEREALLLKGKAEPVGVVRVRAPSRTAPAAPASGRQRT